MNCDKCEDTGKIAYCTMGHPRTKWIYLNCPCGGPRSEARSDGGPYMLRGRWMIGAQEATVETLAARCLELERRLRFAEQVQVELPLVEQHSGETTWLVGRPMPTDDQPFLPLVPR